jgi:hypothetical protein
MKDDASYDTNQFFKDLANIGMPWTYNQWLALGCRYFDVKISRHYSGSHHMGHGSMEGIYCAAEDHKAPNVMGEEGVPL